MKKLLVTGFSLWSWMIFAAEFSADNLQLKIYKFAVSTSNNCSNPITVIDNGSSAQYADFKGDPNLGSGTLADGTYPCIMIEFSDQIKVTPNGTGDVCTTTLFTQDLCGTGSSSQLIDGTTSTCGNSSDDRVTMYLTRASSQTSGTDAFNPPGCNTVGCTASLGIQLGSSLTVAGTAIGTFKVDVDNRICDGQNPGTDSDPDCGSATCEMLPPNFTFTN